MKKIITVLAASLLLASCSEKKETPTTPAVPSVETSETTEAAPATPSIIEKAKEKAATVAPITKADIFEVGCGKCIYKKAEVKGCETWVKVDNNLILPLVSDIDAHSTGLCQDSAQADITGTIANGKFTASEAMLLSK